MTRSVATTTLDLDYTVVSQVMTPKIWKRFRQISNSSGSPSEYVGPECDTAAVVIDETTTTCWHTHDWYHH